MKNFVKRAGCLLLAGMMFVSASATNIQKENELEVGEKLNVVLSPVTQGRLRSAGQDITFTVDLEDTDFEHDSEIPIKMHVKWDKENWDATLSGDALVYNSGEQIVLFGMANGYNGEEIDDNFISMNFTYDVMTQSCIANATYDITTTKNQQVEFGVNTDAFSDAYAFLESKMIDSQANEDKTEEEVMHPGLRAVDTGVKQLVSISSDYMVLKAYAPKTIMSSGVGPMSATIKANTSKAESYIKKNLQSTAWAVVASNCDAAFSTSTGLRFVTNTMHPTASEKNLEISIPLPYSQSYTFKYNVSKITSSMRSNNVGCDWTVYDISGISGIGNNSGVAFKSELNQSGNTYGSIRVNASGKVGYHYLYIDSTGKQNNSTWYYSDWDYGNVTTKSA